MERIETRYIVRLISYRFTQDEVLEALLAHFMVELGDATFEFDLDDYETNSDGLMLDPSAPRVTLILRVPEQIAKGA